MTHWHSGINSSPRSGGRVRENIRLSLSQDLSQVEDVIAARHLFSHLAHLEDIAVLAADRGDCVVDQLEDELVHRETFKQLAEDLGGMTAPSYEVRRIIEYLANLEGEESLAALNVVAESWLERVFVHLAKSGFCSDMFTLIGAEEARHAHEALESAKPDPEAFTETVRDLEEMLTLVSGSPEFMLPLHWFMGLESLGDMGLDMCDAHEKACKHLGVEPDVHNLRVSGRSARLLSRNQPYEIEMSDWERVKLQNWTDFAPQYCNVTTEIPTTIPLKLQAMIMEATGRVLDREPRLRNVTRRGKLFRTDHALIGMRSLYDSEQVITLFVAKPHRKGWKRTLRLLKKSKDRLKEREYEPYLGGVRLCSELKDIFPPNRCSCVVTYNGDFGGDFGAGPLSDMEGIPCSITIGKIRSVPRFSVYGEESGEFSMESINASTICFQMDHRTGDGQDIGKFATEVCKELMK